MSLTLDTKEQRYTTALSAAQGIIPESLELFDAWYPGEARPDFVNRALSEGMLASATQRRAENILKEGFAARFLSEPAFQSAPALKRLVDGSAPRGILHPIFLIFAIRQHLILREFLTEIYWPRFRAGNDSVNKRDALELIERGEAIGRFKKSWSPTVKNRVGAYVLGIAHDFGLLSEVCGAGGQRRIELFRANLSTALFLAYDLHFQGVGTEAIISHPDWEPLGLSPADVRDELSRLSQRGHLLFQDSGDIASIQWKYSNLEAVADAILAE
ncbi:MAG: DUF1819 family protein [Akkermansiaceae bacterium]|nr:DUF1819 family protein [Akkermansiaceae bacterium]